MKVVHTTQCQANCCETHRERLSLSQGGLKRSGKGAAVGQRFPQRRETGAWQGAQAAFHRHMGNGGGGGQTHSCCITGQRLMG